MDQRKWNNTPRHMLALALLLCAAALAAATGTAFARYQAERDVILEFKVRAPAQICMGTIQTVTAEDGTVTKSFDPNDELTWIMVMEDELYQLDVTVGNGISGTSYSAKNQTIRLRLISSVGITEDTVISLLLPPETEGAEAKEIIAAVTPIEEQTNLYTTNGAGYIYTFHEQKEGTEGPGEELTWTLPGGKLSYLTFSVLMRGKLPEQISLLQPQVVAELID